MAPALPRRQNGKAKAGPSRPAACSKPKKQTKITKFLGTVAEWLGMSSEKPDVVVLSSDSETEGEEELNSDGWSWPQWLSTEEVREWQRRKKEEEDFMSFCGDQQISFIERDNVNIYYEWMQSEKEMLRLQREREQQEEAAATLFNLQSEEYEKLWNSDVGERIMKENEQKFAEASAAAMRELQDRPEFERDDHLKGSVPQWEPPKLFTGETPTQPMSPNKKAELERAEVESNSWINPTCNISMVAHASDECSPTQPLDLNEDPDEPTLKVDELGRRLCDCVGGAFRVYWNSMPRRCFHCEGVVKMS
tara:strand:- start:39 stop:959 length:921 start_codon:yes stop_codon:yes gene_type:complete